MRFIYAGGSKYSSIWLRITTTNKSLNFRVMDVIPTKAMGIYMTTTCGAGDQGMRALSDYYSNKINMEGNSADISNKLPSIFKLSEH